MRAAGGLAAIASSHPHFYGALVEWSQAFDGIPIYLHAADQGWVMRPDPAMVFWEGPTYPIASGLTLIHCGGISPVRPCFTGPRVLIAEVHSAPGIRSTWWKTIATSALCTVTSIMTPYQDQPSDGLSSGSSLLIRPHLQMLCWVVTSDAQAAIARSSTRYLHAIGNA